MRRSAVLFLAVTLLTPPGCAYQRAMRDGDRAAASGDWVAAWDAYNAAFAVKPKPEAGQATRDAQVKASEILVRDGKAAVGQGDWDTAGTAYKRLVAMGGEDQSARLELRDHIKPAFYATIEELLGTNPDGAYALALRGRELFGPDPFVDEALDKVHTRFRSRAEELKTQGRFAEALMLLQGILDREPQQEQVLALSIAQLREAWADHLAGEAALAARKKRPGVSAVLLARAYEVGGRSGDLSTAQAQAEAVGEAAKVRVHVKAEGDPGRARTVRDTVRANLEEADRTVAVGETTAALLVALNVEKAACTESKSVAPQSKEYVAKQIDVPTPESEALNARLGEATAALQAVEAEVASAAGPLEAAKAAFATVDGEFQKAAAARDEAKKTLERARNNLAQQQALLQKLEGQLAAATDDAERKTLQAKVAAIGANVLEWEEEVTEWQAAHDKAVGEAAREDSERAPARADLDSAEAAYAAVAARRDAAKARVAEVNEELSQTPATMKQPVMETLNYDVITWTRACRAPVSGNASAKWKSALDRRMRWDPVKETQDTAQSGHTLAGVAEDPKSYPTEETEDLGAVKSEAIAAITAWIGERVAESYRLSADAALAQAPTAADVAADQAVALYLAAGPTLAPETVEAIRAHVKATYGLEKLELLREAPAPAEAAGDGSE